MWLISGLCMLTTSPTCRCTHTAHTHVQRTFNSCCWQGRSLDRVLNQVSKNWNLPNGSVWFWIVFCVSHTAIKRWNAYGARAEIPQLERRQLLFLYTKCDVSHPPCNGKGHCGVRAVGRIVGSGLQKTGLFDMKISFKKNGFKITYYRSSLSKI